MFKHREAAVQYIEDQGLDISKKDIYEFGIYTGGSMMYIEQQLYKHNLKPNCVYGFDSFEGLPEEQNNLPLQNCWKKGGFDSREYFKKDNAKDAMNFIKDKLKTNTNNLSLDIQTILVGGFFQNTLDKYLVKNYNLKPACLIDIDVDLYISTKQIFTFMFENRLIEKNTVIIYDDWGGVPEFTGGESLAHKEIMEKYNVKVKEIFSIGRRIPHIQKVFVVMEVNYE